MRPTVQSFAAALVVIVVVSSFAVSRTAVAQAKPREPDPPSVPVEQTIRLSSATIEDVERAGSGRYLLLHVPRLRAVAVLDVTQRKVARYLPADADAFRMAGGATKAVFALNDKGLLQRWDLSTFTLDATVKLPGPPGAVAMGSASEGPLLCGREFLDLATLARLPVGVTTYDGGQPRSGFQYGTFDTGPLANVVARADGQAFLSDRHVLAFRASADATVYVDSPPVPGNWPGLPYFPMYPHWFQVAGAKSKYTSEVAVPSADDRYFVMVEFKASMRRDTAGLATDMMTTSHARAHVRRVSDGRAFSDPILLEEFDFVGTPPLPGLPIDRRVYFDPATGLLATIPASGDRVLFRTVWRDLRER